MRLFLLSLIIVLATAACAADGQPETAVDIVVTSPALATIPPAATEKAFHADLPIIAPAPAWENEVWINSEMPLPLEDLRGKVVLLEFWTFG